MSFIARYLCSRTFLGRHLCFRTFLRRYLSSWKFTGRFIHVFSVGRYLYILYKIVGYFNHILVTPIAFLLCV